MRSRAIAARVLVAGVNAPVAVAVTEVPRRTRLEWFTTPCAPKRTEPRHLPRPRPTPCLRVGDSPGRTWCGLGVVWGRPRPLTPCKGAGGVSFPGEIFPGD